MSGLVPFLLCSLLQGPCVGRLRPEASFLRRTPSTWRTGTNTSIGPVGYIETAVAIVNVGHLLVTDGRMCWSEVVHVLVEG